MLASAMQIPQHIARMEKLLEIERVSVNAVCKEAHVDRSVWTRLKQGKYDQPRGDTVKRLRRGIALASEGRIDASWFLRGDHQQAAD